MTIFGIRNLCFLFVVCFILMGYRMFTESVSKELPCGQENTPRRGISIGNALEAPKGECWGVEMRSEYFDIIKEAGFDTVRIPVRFSEYTSDSANGYKLDEDFLEKVDGYIEYGLSLGLNIILDLHHYSQIMDNPDAEYDKLTAIWKQLSIRAQNYPSSLIFEILNEPQNKLEGEIWNQYLRDVIAIIRENNPERLIIVGGGQFNSVKGLDGLSLPEDRNIMVTFHYYSPPEFTFQGNPYHEGYEDLNGITWSPGEEELEKIDNDFKTVKEWAERNNVKVLLGEFGAVNSIPFEYRGAWTGAVAAAAEEYGFSWCYWELCSWFGIMDSSTMQWDYNMLKVLLRR